MADAGHELDMLIRFYDEESYDSAMLAEKVWEFVHRCNQLYTGGMCWLSGYAQHVLAELASDLVIVNSAGEPIQLGVKGGIAEVHKDSLHSDHSL